MGERAIHWIANEGVRISRILKHVKSQSLSGEENRLREQIFEEKPPLSRTEPLSVSVVGSDRTVVVDLSQSPVAEAPTTTDGEATWTIPLRITVHVGESRLNQGSAQPVLAGTAESQPNRPTLPAVAATPMDAEMTAAIEEVRRAGTRSYYDKATE